MSSILLRPLCWARTRFIWPYPVEGHRYKEVEDTKQKQTLKCSVCGKESVAYYD